jgi:hypothetical protein
MVCCALESRAPLGNYRLSLRPRLLSPAITVDFIVANNLD